MAWTSGSLFAEPNRTPLAPGQSRKFHVAVTSNDSRYVQWQMRVMYYWYQKRKVSSSPMPLRTTRTAARDIVVSGVTSACCWKLQSRLVSCPS